MNPIKPLAVIAAAVTLLMTPAFADDCLPVSTAMIGAATTPHTSIVTRVKNGKPVTDKMIQTKDDKFIQMNGEWRSMGIAPDDTAAIEAALKKAKMTCRKMGVEQVGGQAATLYTAHLENEDSVSDNKIWLGSNGLPLKVDNLVEGESNSAIFDYEHAEAPANAAPMRAK
jgi:hypothetical protein